jgi:phenylacetate-coenzyme A ligase PaaK-like adenylate-forming protein
MSDALLRLYHRLPAGMRTVAATLHGLHLRNWRYGPETERLVEEAFERERWGPEQWRVWREERLAFVLHRAATCVPYYRDHWAARRRRGDAASWERLEQWPILEKAALRANPRAFIADDCAPRSMYRDHTSGTSGTPLDVWCSRTTVRSWYALLEARAKRWYGVSRSDRWAILGGQLVTPVSQRRPPYWVWNAGLRQLYMSSYHLSPASIGSYLDALIRYRVTYVLGYSSALYVIAREAVAAGRTDVRLRVAITNAEPLLEHQREAIGAAFGCPVRETYGMAETVAAGSECEFGVLHEWPEVGWIEVLEEGRPVVPGQAGEFVCTSLFNIDTPLIRYRVGDRGAVEDSARSCRCGRTLPIFREIEGRCDDVLYTTDGRRVGRLDPVFKGGIPLREAQIVQEALEVVRVRYVPAPGFGSAHGRVLVERLQARLGPIKVVLEEVQHIPRTRNGKFRAVVCELSATEREQVPTP